MHLDVKAFGVINTGCGDEWLAGDESVACWADDARLWPGVGVDWRLRSVSRSWMPKPQLLLLLLHSSKFVGN